MFTRHPKIAASCIGLTVITLAFWGSFSYLRGQDKDDKPKPKEKVEVIETQGETTKKPRGEVKDNKNDPKNPEITKRASAVSCDIHFDNRSKWVIHRMWVDGRLRARYLQPWGDIYIRDVSTGPTELYAEADFTDGTTSRWGPRTVSCRSYQTFSWRLSSSR
jgi:hypothetical protein